MPELISKIETPDDRTIVIRLERSLQRGLRNPIYPRARAFRVISLLDAFSGGDMKAFANLPFWNKNFIGAGPYRVAEWDAGTAWSSKHSKIFPLASRRSSA